MLLLQRPPPSLWLIVVPYSSIEALRKHIADLSTSNPPQASHPLSEPRLRHQHKRRANPPASPHHPARLSMRPPVPWRLPLQLADFYQHTHIHWITQTHTRVHIHTLAAISSSRGLCARQPLAVTVTFTKLESTPSHPPSCFPSLDPHFLSISWAASRIFFLD